MSTQDLDELNSLVLLSLRKIQETGNFEIERYVKDILLRLDSTQRRNLRKACNEILPKGTSNTNRIAGIIAGLATWATVLDDFAMTASFDEGFRKKMHSKLERMTGMKKEDFFNLFDKWDENVGGFQKLRSKFEK